MEIKKYYKGFDADLKCRGFKFEVGETYTHEGKVEACASGFHSCSNPWDVLHYYPFGSRFAEVEIAGAVDAGNDDSKMASAKVTVKAELHLSDFVPVLVAFLQKSAASGHNSNLAASGYRSSLAASGHNSKLAASGTGSNLAASGYHSNLAASGTGSNLAASGYRSNLAASGHNSKLAASGDYSNLAASGDYSNLAASGHNSNLAASGYRSSLAASGTGSNLAASGYRSNLAASGDYSNLAASGTGSNLAASGYRSNLAASGDYSIVVSSGVGGKVKGGKNCALALTRWVAAEKRYRITTAYVGEEDVKPDTWYCLDASGNFVETTG